MAHWLAVVFSFLLGFIPAALYAPSGGGYTSPSAPGEATVLIGGDVMFDRFIRKKVDAQGGDFIFSCIDSVLTDADLVVANLEGPITSNESISASSTVGSAENMTFTFPTNTAQLLKRHHIDLVNIGNNHIMNFSRAGLLETKKWLDEAGVQYVGDPDAPEAERVAHRDVHSIPFAFVNWSDWTSDKTDHTVAQVRTEKEAGYVVVVYTHWGDEYVPPPERVRQLAHSFVDAGAAIVVGSHPHIVQEHEQYHGADIYYSLGNLIFDQYWNDDVRNGLLLRVTFTKDGVKTIHEIPTRLETDGRVCLKTS